MMTKSLESVALGTFVGFTLAVSLLFLTYQPIVSALDVQGSVTIPGNGTLEKDENFDVMIVNKIAGESTAELVFSNNDPNGENSFGTTFANCRQYLHIIYRSNRLNPRLVLYTDNTQTSAANKFTGARTVDDASFTPTSAETTYDIDATETSAQRHNLTAGKKPIPVTGGFVGAAEPKEVVPVVWQIYDEVPSPLPVYDYADPLNPDLSRPVPLRNPTDRWAFMVDRYSLDWHYTLDLQTGHFKVAADANGNGCSDEGGDPNKFCWIPTVGYRTAGVTFYNQASNDWDITLGGFPGKRNTDGYRVDKNEAALSYSVNGLPLNPSLAAPLQSANDNIYVMLAANFSGKHGQGFNSNKLILEYSYRDGTTGATVFDRRELPMRASFTPGKEFGVTMLPKVAGEPTDQLCFSNAGFNTDGTCKTNSLGTTAVNAREYLEVTANSNTLAGKFVLYADNAVADAVPRLELADMRDLALPFTPSTIEKAYSHPLPDNLGRIHMTDGRRPMPVTGGLVGAVDTALVVPVVWQVYDTPDIDPNIAGTQYPNYNYSNPLDPQATDRWGFLMERFGWDWNWAVDYGDLDTSGHLKIAVDANGKNGCSDEGGDPANHCWIPTTGYRTVMDSFSNLGGFPGARDAGGVRIQGKLLQGTSPIYVFFGANFAGKAAQTYRTSKIILEFTE